MPLKVRAISHSVAPDVSPTRPRTDKCRQQRTHAARGGRTLLAAGMIVGHRYSDALLLSDVLKGEGWETSDFVNLARYPAAHLPRRGIFKGMHNRTRLWMLDPERTFPWLSAGGAVSGDGYVEADAAAALAKAAKEGAARGAPPPLPSAGRPRRGRAAVASTSLPASMELHEEATASAEVIMIEGLGLRLLCNWEEPRTSVAPTPFLHYLHF